MTRLFNSRYRSQERCGYISNEVNTCSIYADEMKRPTNLQQVNLITEPLEKITFSKPMHFGEAHGGIPPRTSMSPQQKKNFEVDKDSLDDDMAIVMKEKKQLGIVMTRSEYENMKLEFKPMKRHIQPPVTELKPISKHVE